MAQEVKTGDRVRVTLEGDARPFQGSKSFDIGPGRSANFINPIVPHVVSIEVLKPKLKVGDIVSGDEFQGLPLGTVVRDDRGADLYRSGAGWVSPNGSEYAVDQLTVRRTIVHLPAA